MRKVIYAWNYREWGGVQIYFLSLIKEVRRSYRVTVVLPQDSDGKIIKALDDLGVEHVFTDPAPTLVKPKGIIAGIIYRRDVMASENRLVSKILSMIGKNDTIVHIDFGFWQSLFPLFRLSRKTRVFVTQHTGITKQATLDEFRLKVKGRIAASFRKLCYLASNADAKSSLLRYLGNSRSNAISVTYSGFDPDEIETVMTSYAGNAAVRQKYKLSPSPLIVTVGQFIDRKGCWVVAEALKRLVDEGVDFTFLWLATTPMNQETRTRLDTYGLGRRFRFMSSDDIGGSRTELLSIVLASDIFALASIQEGLPIALVEAMALGRACVATNVNAIPEAIENGKSGILIEPHFPAALADALVELLGDAELRERLGSAARIVAYERFDEKVTATTTLKLYDSVWKTTE